MKKSQKLALNLFLSNYPKDKTYDEILELVESGHDNILIWKPFTGYYPYEIVEFIVDLQEAIENEYGKQNFVENIS